MKPVSLSTWISETTRRLMAPKDDCRVNVQQVWIVWPLAIYIFSGDCNVPLRCPDAKVSHFNVYSQKEFFKPTQSLSLLSKFTEFWLTSKVLAPNIRCLLNNLNVVKAVEWRSTFSGLNLCKEVRCPTAKENHCYNNLHLMVRVQFLTCRKCGVTLYCYYS